MVQVTVEQMDLFNTLLQEAIEGTPEDGVKIRLAQVKLAINRRFYEETKWANEPATTST